MGANWAQRLVGSRPRNPDRTGCAKPCGWRAAAAAWSLAAAPPYVGGWSTARRLPRGAACAVRGARGWTAAGLSKCGGSTADTDGEACDTSCVHAHTALARQPACVRGPRARTRGRVAGRSAAGLEPQTRLEPAPDPGLRRLRRSGPVARLRRSSLRSELTIEAWRTMLTTTAAMGPRTAKRWRSCWSAAGDVQTTWTTTMKTRSPWPVARCPMNLGPPGGLPR